MMVNAASCREGFVPTSEPLGSFLLLKGRQAHLPCSADLPGSLAQHVLDIDPINQAHIRECLMMRSPSNKAVVQIMTRCNDYYGGLFVDRVGLFKLYARGHDVAFSFSHSMKKHLPSLGHIREV